MQSQHFNCPLCQLTYNRNERVPKLVSSCGHTFCVSCLEKIITSKASLCPLDNVPFDQSLKTVEAYPINHLVLQLLEEGAGSNKKLYNSTGWNQENGNNDFSLKKNFLEKRIAEFDKNHQKTLEYLEKCQKSVIGTIQSCQSNLIALISRDMSDIELEIDNFFDHEKAKLNTKFRQDLALKKEIEEKIALLLDPIKNKDFVESFDETNIKPFQTLNESKLTEDFAKEIKDKIKEALGKLEDSIFNLSTQIKKNLSSRELQNFTPASSPNLLFYQNKIKCQPSDIFLENIHGKWFGNYKEIESKEYLCIQWLFPNFFESKVNPAAKKLELSEAKVFKNDIDIAKKVVKSYEIMLDFYGMRLKSYATGEVQRGENWKIRYQDTLITTSNYHAGIRRILACLNTVGFRKYAIELVDFLETEIYGEKGAYKKFKAKDKSFDTQKYDNAPLMKISMSKAFEIFAIYGDHENNSERIKLLEENCLCKYPSDFEDSVFITWFKNTTAGAI